MLSPNTTYRQAAGSFKSFRSPATPFQPWAVSPQLSAASRWLSTYETWGGFPFAAWQSLQLQALITTRWERHKSPQKVHCNHQLPFILHGGAACHQLWTFGCPPAQHVFEAACRRGLTGEMDFTAPAQSILRAAAEERSAVFAQQTSGKQRHRRCPEDVVLAGNQEKAVNPQQASL